MAMTREQAWDLLSKYNKEPFHLRHAITVEHVMGWFAEHLGYGEERELWSLVGLLHDLDFEMWPEEHCKKSQELMRQAGVDEAIIHATASHGWGLCVDIKPEHEMEKVLFACDELTGLIGAAALMRPSKSCKVCPVQCPKVCCNLVHLSQPPNGWRCHDGLLGGQVPTFWVVAVPSPYPIQRREVQI